MTTKNPHVGSSLDEFLREEGILKEARSLAAKEALAWQAEQPMKYEKLSTPKPVSAGTSKPQ